MMKARKLHPHVALTGESPIWDPDRQMYWWLDIQGQWLLGSQRDHHGALSIPLPSQPGLIALAETRDLIIGLEDGLWRHSPEGGDWALLCPVEATNTRTRINDGRPDKQGRLWFGTMEKYGSGEPIGGLYCWSPDDGLTKLRSNVAIPNAIAFSPDGHRMFFADSPSGTLESWAVDPDRPALSERQEFASWPSHEKPDGASVDVEGGLWIAVVGGGRIDRFDAGGARMTPLAVPVTRPTMPAFGGTGGTELVVTSQRRFLSTEELARQPFAGQLLGFPAPVAGLPTWRCRV
jgi:sugar lactone lactonase YvrE